MTLEVHFEAIYNIDQSNPENLHENGVVATRRSLSAASADSLEELFAREANDIFAVDPLAMKGHHHRVRILGTKAAGGKFNPEPRMYIPVTISQTT
jgi:hypothetical protein